MKIIKRKKERKKEGIELALLVCQYGWRIIPINSKNDSLISCFINDAVADTAPCKWDHEPPVNATHELV